MLIKKIPSLSSIRFSKSIFKYAFSSEGQKGNNNKNDEVEQTKWNPNKNKDLRGYEGFNEFGQAGHQSSPVHSRTYDKTTAYSFFSLLPISVLKFITKNVDHQDVVLSSDSVNYPKISPNGMPVHDLINSNQYRLNSLALNIVPILTPGLIVASAYPIFSIIATITYSSAYYFFHWKGMKDLVFKTELLPNTEEIVYQKMNLMGDIYTKKVSVNDIQHIDGEIIFDEHSGFTLSSRNIFNPEYCFRVKSTGQLLLFHRNGIWHKEGIENELLV